MVLDKLNFSFTRFTAVLIKEFIQMWRDKATFAMMVILPIMQLTIFGFALNSDPKSLPAGVLSHNLRQSRRLERTAQSGYLSG